MLSLERFRAMMEADPTLQERLNQPDDPASFIATTVSMARDHGIDLNALEVAAALESGRQIPASNHVRLPPRGWLPVRTQWHERALWLDWAYVGPEPFREPFFEQSVVRWCSKPFNRLFRYATPFDALTEAQPQHLQLAPSGFIFHMSRCGSTLVSQMLAASPRHVVISEAEPIDAVVQARRPSPDLTEDQQVAMLRTMVGALGQARSSEQQHLFVKLDSWHTLALPLFRRAFPDTPWIFLYREPVEILVSHSRRRGMHMVPGLLGDVFGEPPEAAPNLDAYCGHVLGRIGESALQNHAHGASLLVNYTGLPEAIWTDVLPHFGIHCSAADRAAMAHVGQYDAKTPDRPFAGDSIAKREAATPAIVRAASRLSALHARLEALRATMRDDRGIVEPARP
ncbi:sulfotransferase [Bradyrhizobium guangzhouense]|uniref:Aspartyl beta-hydroxylase n=1 Tax=Bradyrhizobium guangzhouense TaxID=1325095 RepID=A0AAE5WZZ8_9BRAD|nr:sulfotransferase [Bradyrhizobium guangzhouense]QAU46352.1 aspartyl beta-hydroxylase [Bradyrhizobium guangzhouense]RXH15354.1 aspartyl beta-hydroxylase [Bradyrhizobium guangzhouense]